MSKINYTKHIKSDTKKRCTAMVARKLVSNVITALPLTNVISWCGSH
jgi:hypothetical protein